MPENRPVPLPGVSVLFYLSKVLFCPLRLRSGLCPAQPSSPTPARSLQPSPQSSVGLMLSLWVQTKHLMMISINGL